ncbi:receptor activity-modifying protein 2 isoform X1 [Elgaria multicarinata webbii]|uniref:receptor activity-modifying protein 2 isoform X1 n=1 Tax=Elgaria multicarinata webbii TaxID=159646 RepID=UPI002FCCE09E
MAGQCLSLQLLLLAFTAIGLDAHSWTTTATPQNVNISLEEGNRTFYIHALYSVIAENCWRFFVHQMGNVSKVHWCEWRAISRPYSELRRCLEEWADNLSYGFPNALADNYTVFSHRMYFLNCTEEYPLLMDPPENVLLPLIITPICLIPFLVTLVVLKSKDGEMQS